MILISLHEKFKLGSGLRFCDSSNLAILPIRRVCQKLSGRLASVSSSVSNYSYSGYDATGKPLGAAQVIGSQTYTLGYEYNLAGENSNWGQACDFAILPILRFFQSEGFVKNYQREIPVAPGLIRKNSGMHVKRGAS